MKNKSRFIFAVFSTLSLALLFACNSTPVKSRNDTSPTASVWNAFSLHDSNSDGNIDLHEFHQFRKDPQVLSLFPDRTSLQFNDIDEDNDSKISEQELTTAIHSQ